MNLAFFSKIVDFLIKKNFFIVISLLAFVSFSYSWAVSYVTLIVLTIIFLTLIKKNGLSRLVKNSYFQLTLFVLIPCSYVLSKLNVLENLLIKVSFLIQINPVLIFTFFIIIFISFFCIYFKKIHKVFLLLTFIFLIIQLFYIPLFSYTLIKEQQSYIEFYKYFSENNLKPNECNTGEIACFSYNKDIVLLPQKINNVNPTIKNEMTFFLTNLVNKVESNHNSFILSFPSDIDMYIGLSYIPYVIYNGKTNIIMMDFKTPKKIFNVNFDFYAKIVLIALKFWFVFGYILILLHINSFNKRSKKRLAGVVHEVS